MEEEIILTQEWVETPNGWFSLGYNEPIEYEIKEEIDWDNNFQPIKAIFKLK